LRTGLNDGALSFYAGRVLPPLDAQEIGRALEHNGEIWLIGETLPELAGVAARVVSRVDNLTLFHLQRQP